MQVYTGVLVRCRGSICHALTAAQRRDKEPVPTKHKQHKSTSTKISDTRQWLFYFAHIGSLCLCCSWCSQRVGCRRFGVSLAPMSDADLLCAGGSILAAKSECWLVYDQSRTNRSIRSAWEIKHSLCLTMLANYRTSSESCRYSPLMPCVSCTKFHTDGLTPRDIPFMLRCRSKKLIFHAKKAVEENFFPSCPIPVPTCTF